MAESIISPGVFTRENDISFIQPAPIAAGAAFIGPAVKGPINQPTIVTSYNDYVRKFGAVFQSGSDNHEFFTSMAVRNYFGQGGLTALVTRVVSGSYTAATNSNIPSQGEYADDFVTPPYFGDTPPFVLETLGKGAIYNNGTGSEDPGTLLADGSLVSGSADNLRWEVGNINENSGTFSLLIRRGDDSTNNKVILETFNNLSLDPNSDNYIERVVGNQTLTFDGSVNRLTGEYVNRSNYVRIKEVSFKTLNYLANDGLTINEDAQGNPYSYYLPSVASGSFSGAIGTIKDGANLYDNITVQTQGLIGANYTTAITLLENKDEYQFNVIAAPGLTNQNHSTQIDSIISLAEQRGDCIAVVDLRNHDSSIPETTTQAADLNTSYAASYWPWLQVQSAANKTVWVPASVVIPGVYAFTDASSAPWFAPAGLVRGGISGVIQTELKLTKSQRDILYAAKVNPIATFPGTGISVFGQKTLQTKASALDRVNVRRLLIELKKFIGDQARNLVFEQNTIATRNRFLATVNPYLESVVQRQGLFAYRVVMDDSNNTADVVDRNQLVGQIFIQPTRTVEFVVLDFTIEPTGATFS